MLHFGYHGTSFYNHHCNLYTKMLTAPTMDPTDEQYMQDGVDHACYTYNTFFHLMNISVHKNLLTYEMPWLIFGKKLNFLKAETLILLTKRNVADNFVGYSQIRLKQNRRVNTNKILYLSKLLIGTLIFLELYWWYLVAEDLCFVIYCFHTVFYIPCLLLMCFVKPNLNQYFCYSQ